jgi:hypothetical protein
MPMATFAPAGRLTFSEMLEVPVAVTCGTGVVGVDVRRVEEADCDVMAWDAEG